jgi:hypothetical protein
MTAASNDRLPRHGRIAGLILSLAMATSLPAFGQGDVDFVVGLSLGNTTLEFDEKLDADTAFPSYAVFASAGIGNVFATLSWSDSISSQNISEEDELGEASRSDLDLTLGYRFNEHWSAFIGYKDGSTDIDFLVRDTDIVQQEYYREQGFYAGGSYSWRFQRAGTLSFTAAYIRFDSDLRFTEGFEEEEEEEEEDELPEFDDLEGTFSGDADGYSVGVTWVMPIGDRLAFRALYKINHYELEVEDDGLLFKPEQELRYLQLGLLYAF